MKTIFTFLSITLLTSVVLFSQEKTQNTKPISNFVKQQQEFKDWAKGKDLSKEEGWKWYKRWQDQNAKRANADGSLPDEYEYFRESINIAEQKNMLAKTTAASWTPVGPFNVPGAPVGSGLDYYGIGRINTITFHPTDSSTFWVGVAQGGVWKTTNGGQSYMPLTDNLPILRISDICVDPAHPDTMYISVCDYGYIGVALHTDGRKRMAHYGLGVFKTTNGGQSWSPTGLSFNQTNFDGSLIRRVFVNATNSNDLVAAGTGGIWKSPDGGGSWTKIIDSLIWDIEQDPTNKNILYASGGYVSKINEGSACILKSTDFGSTWTLLNTGIPKTGSAQRIELAISTSDPNYVYALCCNMSQGLHAIYRTTNGGSTWSQRCTTPNILSSNGNGSGGQGAYDLTIIVNPTDRNTIYTGGLTVWGSNDGGTTMNQVNDYYSIHPDQHFFAYNNLNNTYYLCNDGGLYKAQTISQTLNTTSWTRISDGMQIPSYYRVSTSKNNPNFLIAGAQDNGTVYYNGSTWNFVNGGDGMDGSMDGIDSSTMIVSSQFGYFEKTTDGGQTLTSLNITGENGEWTTPIERDPTNNNVLYAGYENLHKSTDNGDNWSPISNITGPPITSIAICPSNNNYIYLTKRVQTTTSSGAMAWRTSNGGSSWTDITAGLPDSLYFIDLAVDDVNPNTVWVSVGGFYPGVKVFQTIDGGLNWTNISYNLPNLPVNTVLKRTGTNELYVGCDVGIYKLDNGQTTWQLFSNGLPNVIVSDLEIYYATNKMYCSTFGRGIWSVDLTGGGSSVNENPIKDAVITINPSLNNGEFQLSISGMNTGKGNFEIIDIMGRKVLSETIELNAGNFNKNYKLQLNYGLYFAKVSAQSVNSKVIRFMVK